MKTWFRVPFLTILIIAMSNFAQDAAPSKPAVKVDYVTQVKPIFAKYCYQCHSNERSKAGVRLDDRANSLMHITAGDPMHSDVYRSITRSIGTSDHMPPVPKDQPSAADIATIKLWIEQGANWPNASEDSKHEN